ncbi:MAG: hypothetical protein IPP01_12120 [Saprospiraceae bacterium]|nr:hypothetical protein [Saprospiraceae bacterium]
MKDRKFDNLNWGNFDEENYSFNVDEQWDRMEATLLASRKKKDRRFFFFFLAAGMLMFFSVAGYVYIPKWLNHKNNIGLADLAPAISEAPTESATSITNSQSNKSQIATKALNNKTTNSSKNSTSRNVGNTTISQNNQPIADKINHKSNIVNQANTIPSYNNINTVDHQSELTSIKTEALPSPYINTNEVTLSHNNFLNIATINQIHLPTSIQQNNSNINSTHLNLQLIPVIKTKKQTLNSFICFGIQYGLSNNNFKLLDQDKNDIVSSRNLREKSWDGIQSEIGIGVFISKNMYIQSGINMNRRYTKVIDNYTVSNQYLENQIVRIEKRDGEKPDTIRNPVLVTTRSKYNEKYFNKYDAISIPILVGFKKPISTRSSLSLDAGTCISVWNQNYGYIPRSFTAPNNISITQLAQAKYGSIAIRSTVNYNYQLTSKNSVSIGFGIEQDLTSRISSTEGYTQKFRFINIGTKLLRKF